MFSRIISEFQIMNLNRKFYCAYDPLFKIAQITILISANQEEEPKIFKKFSKKTFFGKKYYPVPQISPQIALTRKCFNRVHPNDCGQGCLILGPPKLIGV
jgi:hypothetical protein